jgi:hypothetical protein
MAQDKRVGRVQRVLSRLAGNREELQHIEPSRARLEVLFGQIQDAAGRQALHTAGKQEASQQFQSLLTEAERLITVLLLAVKQHYGIRAEKLADFGLKPFRGRTRKAGPTPKPPAPEPEPPAPEPTTPPTTTATARPSGDLELHLRGRASHVPFFFPAHRATKSSYRAAR